MNTVKTMLDIKGHEVYSIGPDATVHQAVELMAAREIGALIVVTRDNYLAGIVSERDYARKVLLKNFHLCSFCRQVFTKNHQQLKDHIKTFHKIDEEDFQIKSNELIEENFSKKKTLKII